MRRRLQASLPLLGLLAVLLLAVRVGAAQQPPELDVVLAGGTVFDGSGGAGRTADVGIAGERIAAVGDLSGRNAKLRLDVSGLALTPGFIDLHSHAVRDDPDTSGLFLWPDAENYLRQGVTTAIGGPDGGSWLPVGELLERVEAAPAAVNFGTFVGHNRVRSEVMGRADRPASPEELEAMEAQVSEAMRQGAFGLSSGLKYVPGAYAGTDELIALARVAAVHGGIYITHMREEGTGLLDSVQEMIHIAEEARIPAQITHHKAMGASMWGRSADSLALVDAANARGLDVSSDVYPYAASSTGIRVLFPAWSLEGDREARLARLRDTDTRLRVQDGIVENLRQDRGGNDLDRVTIADCRFDRSVNGLTLGEILDGQDISRTLESAADLLMQLEERGSCTAVYHAMDEQDVVRIMQHPRSMIASDGGIYAPGDDMPHPRSYGAFARVLGTFVRDRGTFDFATAVNRMSRMPADRIGLADRGRIEVGAYADLAVLDPAAVTDRATFRQPHQYAEGMVHVFVNGQAVLRDGRMTGARPGKALRSAAFAGPARVAWPMEPPRTVLFVGNSFTYYNNSLHAQLRRMLQETEPSRLFPDSTKAMTISGGRLADHEGGLRQMLGFQPWDIVVLQGHSLEAVDESRVEAFRSAVSRLARMARERGATPVLFMTWAYTDRPEMTPQLESVYRSVARDEDLLLLPVGLAFARAERELPGLQLRTDDLRHPSAAGSYLAASVIYATLYPGLPQADGWDGGLGDDLAASLRRVAAETVRDYYGQRP